MDNLTHDRRIELAISDLESQERPKVAPIARKYALVESTLRWRWNGRSMSRAAAASEYRRRLTSAQEEILIGRINQLANRGLPPTLRMVRNLAEEMLSDSVGINWTTKFVHRHKDRLKSLYLRNIDSERSKAEYLPLFKLFYDLVGVN